MIIGLTGASLAAPRSPATLPFLPTDFVATASCMTLSGGICPALQPIRPNATTANVSINTETEMRRDMSHLCLVEPLVMCKHAFQYSQRCKLRFEYSAKIH